MAKHSPKKTRPTPVESIEHKDTRKNIPTEDLRDFVAKDEQQQMGKMLSLYSTASRPFAPPETGRITSYELRVPS